MIHSNGSAAAAIVLLCATWGCTAWADETTDSGSIAPAAGVASSAFGAGRVVDASRLHRQRGGLDTSNTNSLDGTVHDTSATNVMTGSNTIANGSFANSAGLPTVIQNTGANVLIQNSTIVNVQFK